MVYLANDSRLNRNWAVKEVKKSGNGIKDDIVINSILAEANLIKSLDHPGIPRIVDIIDHEDMIYIVMDFIEGESLDKTLKEKGPATEDQVIDWGLQASDILSYLHSHTPPIVYRDMKPANLMLKPNGRLCIIDFGIAVEYGEMNKADTSVLGTKGYAPPEQYRGRTDQRSDIYALGMTMHQLLTGADPGKSGEYIPVRELNGSVSEGMGAIIDRCTKADPDERYQSCDELMEVLKDPSRITRRWRRRIIRKIAAFAASAAMSLISLSLGVVCNARAVGIYDSEYSYRLSTGQAEGLYEAIDIYPERTEAYMGLVDYYSDHFVVNRDLNLLANTVLNNADKIGDSSQEAAGLYYDVGRMLLTQWSGSFKTRASMSAAFFQKAAGSKCFEKGELAQCYAGLCSFMTEQSRVSEHSPEEYRSLFRKMEQCMDTVEKRTDRESNYDKVSLYYVINLFLDSQSINMAALDLEGEEIESLRRRAISGIEGISSTLPYVLRLQEKMRKGELL